MQPRIVVSLLLVGLWLAGRPAAAPPYMPIDEVRPGMQGVGRTVFDGDRLEEFRVHVLGVLRNVNGPRRNMILARLEGGPLAHTGVIAGMSGSPVWVGGRLIGAVAFSLGQFSKEPMAGITPIHEMIESAGPQVRRAAGDPKPKLELPITRERMTAALQQAFSRFQRPFAESPDEIRPVGLGAWSDPRAAQLATLLRPIATPLVLTGFSGSVRDAVVEAFRTNGFQPAVGAATPAGTGTPARLQPGDPVGVNLLMGDFTMGVTGTVTEVVGDQVYAFGHPFYNLGTTQFPMTRAFVNTILPSLSTSTKLTSTGETIGTFRQDRATAMAGTLGKGPALIPIRIALDTDRGLRKTFSFEVVNDQLLTPLLTYVSILNTLSSYEREYGVATFTVKGKASVRKHGDVAFEDIFTGDTPSIGAATYVVAPITFLLGNDMEPVDLDGVDLQITTREQPQTMTLERVWLDAVSVRPGTTVSLKVLLRTYRGEEITRTVPIDIPANARGSLSILVSDGGRLAQWDLREVKAGTQPRGLAQMIRELNRAKKNNRLYIRLLRPDAGAVVNGESLSALPPSVLAVMESDRSGGSFAPLRNATVGEWSLTTEQAVSGSRLLTITVQGH